MDEEKIIRNEALEFFKRKIERSTKPNAIDDIHELKWRLRDFYTSESKAIFLDEIEFLVKKYIEEHILNSHGGQPSPTCKQEIKIEKLLFYINQEIETLPVIAHQKFNNKEQNIRDKVFISYSHLDKEFLNDIQRHFKPLINKIDIWDDTKIEPGQKWKEEISNAISTTKIAILLVSTDFLGSDFITTNELPPLLSAAEKEGAVILIVILKPCLFEEFHELNKFQAMNPPSRPITKMDYNEKEELFVNLVKQTNKILNNKNTISPK